MSFRSRMDAAYGRRGGRFAEYPVRPRPPLGAASLDGHQLEVLEHRARRRSLVVIVGTTTIGTPFVCADSLIGPPL